MQSFYSKLKNFNFFNSDVLKWTGNDLTDIESEDEQDRKVDEDVNLNIKREGLHNVNHHLVSFKGDYLYHLNLDKVNDDLKEMFKDVKFICTGGTPKRMLQFALYIKDIIGYKFPAGHTFENITETTDRYSMYKIGPVISVNHGMGCPSMSILLNELMKLVLYAGCKDVTFFRMGTCGGIGLKPGTLVITEEAVDGMFRPEYRQIILGKEVSRPTKLDENLVKELLALSKSVKESNNKSIGDVVSGKTLCAHDFYEGQGRIDGVFCDYTVKDKMDFLAKCKENDVKNIEMESLVFSAFTNYAKVRAAIVCVTLVDRLNGDQMTIPHEVNVQYQERPFKLIAEYIKKHLND